MSMYTAILGRQEKVSALEKQLTMANPDIAVFKTLFNQMQTVQNSTVDCLMNIIARDAETGGKLREAVRQLLRQCEGRIEE